MALELNAEQKLAVIHPTGEAALLLAGAGSGKTHTLTERISWLIEQGVDPKRILALTFTNKAAKEIRVRVLKRTGLQEDTGPRLSTIHSLALSFIRRDPTSFGLLPNFSLLDDYGQSELVKKIIDRDAELSAPKPEPGEDEAKPLNAHGILRKVSYFRARGIGFSAGYTEEVHKEAAHEYGGQNVLKPAEHEVWKRYEAEKKRNNTLDFDDIIWFVISRMRNDPQWLTRVQGIFGHVLVDEMQDTNVPQFELITNLLGPDNRNLYLVGDPNQSVFGFQGAQPQLLIRYASDWRGRAPVIYKLARNHRSVQQVVDLANAVQQNMTETLPLTMESFRASQGAKGRAVVTRESTSRLIARNMAYKIVNGGLPCKAYCILVRSSMQVREIEGELVKARIPYVVRGGRGLLQTEEVRDILAYVRFAVNVRDFAALSRAISAPRRGVGDKALEDLRTAADFDADLLEACAKKGGAALGAFVDVIRTIQRFTDSPVEAIETAIKTSGYLGYMKKKYAKEPDKITTKLENLESLKEMVTALVADCELTIEDLMFQLTMERVEPDDEQGQVTISTIHSAKGLEWNVVFVTNLYENSLPHRFSMGNPAEVEEERRLFYVALTRARDTLYLCLPSSIEVMREVGGRREYYEQEVRPSRFLTELGIQ